MFVLCKLIIFLASCLMFASTKIYDRCELARELHERHEIPMSQIATWVCIARYESEYNTSAINRGSGDHGLFQISDLFWCSPPGNGHACGLSCSDLEDDDIEDDVICAKRIHREHTRLSGDGFNAWVVYGSHCKGRNLDEFVRGCFKSEKTSERENNLIDSNSLHGKTLFKTALYTTEGKSYYSTGYSTTPRTIYTKKSYSRYFPTTTTTTTPAPLKLYYSRFAKPTSSPHYYTRSSHHLIKPTSTEKYFTTYKIESKKDNTFNKDLHKSIEHPITGSRYKYHINNSGFVLIKDN